MLHTSCSFSTSTSGTVTRLVPDSHGCVEIRYTVGKRGYIETLRPYVENDTSVGASVAVYYSPNDPQIAYTAPPADVLAEEWPGWLGFALIMSFPITYALPQLGRQLENCAGRRRSATASLIP